MPSTQCSSSRGRHAPSSGPVDAAAPPTARFARAPIPTFPRKRGKEHKQQRRSALLLPPRSGGRPGGGQPQVARDEAADAASRRPWRTRTFVLATVVLIAAAFAPVAAADETGSEAPPGGAIHTLHLESRQLQVTRDHLETAHGTLLQALGADTDEASPLTRSVGRLHARWLDHVAAECDLVGVFTGAGGSWPGVHALTCQRERLARRADIVDAANACLRDLPADALPFQQHECLQPLVEPTPED